MKFGGARGRNLLLLIGLLATLVVVGIWDSRMQMQRVLDEGYATTAQLTGAQFQRTMPFAADGWRPRFVEQELSVDLTWQGQDGKPRTFRKVPISESLARMIVNGDQVRLIPVPVKVLDDESAPPVITFFPSGPKMAERTAATWPRNVCSSFPLATSHRLALLSQAAVTSSLLSALNARASVLLPKGSAGWIAPETGSCVRSHTLATPSSPPPDARRWPSGENVTHCTTL